MALPVLPMKWPSDIAVDGRYLVSNGEIPDRMLQPIGIENFRMHHLAARAMRAMVAAMRAAGIDVRATGTLRSYAQQVLLFDGTSPSSRTSIHGRYIPEHIWSTVPASSLTNDIKHWQGKRWRRRTGTAMAAVPGTSNHGWALAIDFAEERDGDPQPESVSDAQVAWLVRNAHWYGYSAEVQSEPWHWRYIAGDNLPAAVLAFEGVGGSTSGEVQQPPTQPPVQPPTKPPVQPPTLPPSTIQEPNMILISFPEYGDAYVGLTFNGTDLAHVTNGHMANALASKVPHLDFRSGFSYEQAKAAMLGFITSAPRCVGRTALFADADVQRAWAARNPYSI